MPLVLSGEGKQKNATSSEGWGGAQCITWSPAADGAYISITKGAFRVTWSSSKFTFWSSVFHWAKLFSISQGVNCKYFCFIQTNVTKLTGMAELPSCVLTSSRLSFHLRCAVNIDTRWIQESLLYTGFTTAPYQISRTISWPIWGLSVAKTNNEKTEIEFEIQYDWKD